MAEDAKNTKERVSKKTLQERLNKKRKESKFHSARFLAEEQKIQGKVNQNNAQPLAEAIDLVKSTATTKFDSSIELHLHLTAKKGKKGAEDELMRGIIHLPNGLGKVRKVVVLNEELTEEIAKTGNINFDIAIASPSLMPKLGRVAKILGTKGKMPNPKAGTVAENPDAIKAEIEAGRVEFRQDASRNIHQMIGKASWDTDKLVQNARVVLQVFPKNRVASATVTSTMGPAVKINLDV